jgi:hypothetical protein
MSNVDLSEMSDFFKQCRDAANGEFKREMELFLEALGFEFLRIIQEEIVRLEVVDYRLLLNSFNKGDGYNIWEITEGDLTLQVGTNMNYASYVNDGHWTNPNGVLTRWVPGFWTTAHGKDHFICDTNAETGMLLVQKWVEGKHFYESGLEILDKIYPKLLDRKLQEWLNNYFGL